VWIAFFLHGTPHTPTHTTYGGSELALEAKSRGNLSGDVVGHASHDVNGGGHDGLGVLLSHSLNVHAAHGGRDHNRAVVRAVHEDGEVQLLLDVDAFVDQHLGAQLAFLAGLLGDERAAQHLLHVASGLVGTVRSGSQKERKGKERKGRKEKERRKKERKKETDKQTNNKEESPTTRKRHQR